MSGFEQWPVGEVAKIIARAEAAEKEGERARETLEAIHEVVFHSMCDEDLVEHIIDPNCHGVEDTKAHYRGMAKQMREIDEICSKFFEPFVVAMEARALAKENAPRSCDAAPEVPKADAKGYRFWARAETVYCRYCNKTHGVERGDRECSPNCWSSDP